MKLKFTINIITICIFVILLSQSSSQEAYSTKINYKKLSIDHVNIAVGDLSQAKIPYEKLGFTIKPGRIHNNSIDNLHMKFVNGTELELITANEPLDNLAAEYMNLIKQGDGGAFLALQSKSFISSGSNVFQKKYPVRIIKSISTKSMVFDENHPLRPIWFIESRTFKDDPGFTTHDNSALKIIGVWLSNQIENEIIELFTFLNHPIFTTDLPIRDSKKICLEAGTIYLVNLPMNKIGRPIVGVTIEVDKISATKKFLKKSVNFTEISNDSTSSIIISSDFTKNIFIEFREIYDN